MSVLYERLPSYCHYCGLIGHQEDACDLPPVVKRRRYSNKLGMPATHANDERR